MLALRDAASSVVLCALADRVVCPTRKTLSLHSSLDSSPEKRKAPLLAKDARSGAPCFVLGSSETEFQGEFDYARRAQGEDAGAQAQAVAAGLFAGGAVDRSWRGAEGAA